MSVLWKAVILCSGVVAAGFALAGFFLPRLLSYTENIFAEAFGAALGFGLVVLLIEGRGLTQQTRRRRILARVARSILHEASQIGVIQTNDLGNFLVSVLDSKVELDADLGPDWDVDVKPLLRQVFEEAETVSSDDLPYDDALSYEDYRPWVGGIQDFSRRIRNRVEANLDVHEFLLELSEALDCLDAELTRASWGVSVRSEAARFRSLGHLGNALISMIESLGGIVAKL